MDFKYIKTNITTNALNSLLSSFIPRSTPWIAPFKMCKIVHKTEISTYKNKKLKQQNQNDIT